MKVVEPIGLSTKSWVRRRFGDCAQLVNGRAYSQNELLDSGTPVLRIQNLNGGERWYYSNLVLPEEKYCNPGDLLYAWSASFGPYKFSGPKSIFHYHIWRVIPGPDLDKGFAFYLLDWITAAIKSAAHGLAMLHMTKAGMEDWSIALPPLIEQRRIAEVLDRAEGLMAKRRAALAQLDTLTQSIFLDMFGDPERNSKSWPLVSIGDFLFDITNGMTRRRSQPDVGQNIVLRLRDIRNGWIDFSDVNRITLTAKELKKYEACPGDLLFIRVNGNPDYVGRCAIYEGYSEDVYFNDHIMRVRIDGSAINGVFLSYLLNGQFGKSQIAKHLKTSAGQHTINQDGLSKIHLPLPPIVLQVEFSHKVCAINKMKSKHALSLVEFDALFSSLQHRAFRGEL